MARRPKPSGRDVKSSVFRGLRMDANITSAMMPSLSFEPSIGIVAGRIDKLGMDIRSFKEPLTRAVKEVLAPSFQRNFDEGGRPDAWQALSDATLRIRDSMGFSGSKILVRTGNLRRVAGQVNIWDIKQNSAIITGLPENVWYGKIHQGGYNGKSMKERIKRFGGDRKAALDSLLDEQMDILESATLGRTTGALKSRGNRQFRIQSVGRTMGGGGVESIPQRRFIMFQDEDEDAITEVFVKWLDERVARTWGSGTGVVL